MKDETADMILDRMHKAIGSTADNALAKVLGVSAQAVSEARRKQKVPPAWAITLAKQYQVSLDWLLLGTGPMKPDAQAPHTDEDTAFFAPIVAESDLTLEAKVAELEAKNTALETENAALKESRASKDELLQEKEETLAAYRQLLSQTQDALAASGKGGGQATGAPVFVASAPSTDQTNKS